MRRWKLSGPGFVEEADTAWPWRKQAQSVKAGAGVGQVSLTASQPCLTSPRLAIRKVPLTSGQGCIAGSDLRNRLKVLRAERDWSQAELGGRLGVSRQAVNAIETGKYDPSLPLAFKLARLFSMRIEEIFDDGEND